jgi:SAM-dependent methyltransferase
VRNAVALKPRLWGLFQKVFGDDRTKQETLARFITGPGRVLEIGCAIGNVAEAFRGFEYVGVDVDRPAIELAASRFPEPNYRFHCLDILEDELPERGGFDHVLLSHTAHHLPDAYLERLIRRSWSLLREGGRLVVLDMVRPEPDEPFRKQFFYKLDRGQHFRTVPEFEAVLARCGARKPELHVIKTWMFGMEVLDHLVIVAVRPPD